MFAVFVHGWDFFFKKLTLSLDGVPATLAINHPKRHPQFVPQHLLCNQ